MFAIFEPVIKGTCCSMRIRLEPGEYKSQCKYQSVGRQREIQDVGFAKDRHQEREGWERQFQEHVGKGN